MSRRFLRDMDFHTIRYVHLSQTLLNHFPYPALMTQSLHRFYGGRDLHS